MNVSGMTNSLSIIAFDPKNKQLGGGLLTHTFGACQGIIYIEPGVGIVAGQAASNPFYGFAGLALMRLGRKPAEALESIIGPGRDADRQQIAMIDIQGNVAAYTGSRCSPAAGHKTGNNYSCQANLMLRDTVWEKMAEAFESSTGELADRLMSTMEAGDREGGDSRGARCALLKVYNSEPPQRPWSHLVYDFRIYDHREPLKELQRLVKTQRAHLAAGAANSLLERDNASDGQIATAREQLNEALSSIQDVECRLEHQYNQAVLLFNLGRTEEAIEIFRQVFAVNPIWREIIARDASLNPDKPYAQQLDRILAQ